MSAEDGREAAVSLRSAANPAAADTEGSVSGRGRKSARPKIDLDDEIRRANDLAAMSRKMLSAAKNVSRNTKKAKQRLIKKAGKLSPEDLERIAVLKRCGMFDDDDDEDDDNAEAESRASGSKKGSTAGPSAAEAKRPKLTTSLETLTAANPILQEMGMGVLPASSPSSASSAAKGSIHSQVNKKSSVQLGARARLPRAPSVPAAVGGDKKTDETDE